MVALCFIHIIIGIFAGLLAVILPAIRERFALTLSLSVITLTVLNLVNNVSQIFIGRLREDKTKPLLLPMGLVLMVCSCFMGFFSASPYSLWILISLAAFSGLGIGITYPEAFRAVHGLDKISTSVSSAVFIAGGSIGFTLGGFLSSWLVSRFNLEGLFFYFLCPVVGIGLIISLRIQLAVESDTHRVEGTIPRRYRLPFWPIFVMAVPSGSALLTQVSLLTTLLTDVGFDLDFGGFSVMCFGLSGVVGSFFWAHWSRRDKELIHFIVCMIIGIPLLFLYFFLSQYRSAVLLLILAGPFSFYASFGLVISLARNASGPVLGQRMAWIMGGLWAIASVSVFIFGYLAEQFGLRLIMYLLLIGYVVSIIVGIWIFKQYHPRAVINGQSQ